MGLREARKNYLSSVLESLKPELSVSTASPGRVLPAILRAMLSWEDCFSAGTLSVGRQTSCGPGRRRRRPRSPDRPVPPASGWNLRPSAGRRSGMQSQLAPGSPSPAGAGARCWRSRGSTDLLLQALQARDSNLGRYNQRDQSQQLHAPADQSRDTLGAVDLARQVLMRAPGSRGRMEVNTSGMWNCGTIHRK